MFEDFSETERLTFLKAVANLAAADRNVTEDEEAELNGLVLEAGLSTLDERVETEVIGELKNPGEIKPILEGIENDALRQQLFRVLVAVAAADGVITDNERSKVRDAAGMFDLDPDAASEYLDWTIEQIAHEKKEEEILSRLGIGACA